MYTTSCSLPLPGDVCRFDLSRIPLILVLPVLAQIFTTPLKMWWSGKVLPGALMHGYVHSKHSLYNGHCVHVYYGNSSMM